MSDLLLNAFAFLLAVVFAAVWGAHVFETAVLYSAWAAEPPKSFFEFLATRSAKTLARFWQILAPSLYTVAITALIIAFVAGMQMHLALALAGICGLIHLAMIVLIFAPTNTKLGFYGGPGAASLDPRLAKTLIRRWGRWIFVRLGFETAGLVAALVAFKAS